MAGKAGRKKQTTGRNRFRVIGGAWRGRHLQFPDGPAIRPTPDRVRETVFNWLQARVAGARCLDLFAGSGALGIEALSRGAAEVLFVEQDRRAAKTIAAHIDMLEANGNVYSGNAFDFLQGNQDTFDIAFLDPPFGDALLKPAMEALLASGALGEDPLVYMEAAKGELADGLCNGWEFVRDGKAGQVEFGIAATAALKEQGISAE